MKRGMGISTRGIMDRVARAAHSSTWAAVVLAMGIMDRVARAARSSTWAAVVLAMGIMDQVVRAARSSTWARVARAMHITPPGLAASMARRTEGPSGAVVTD